MNVSMVSSFVRVLICRCRMMGIGIINVMKSVAISVPTTITGGCSVCQTVKV